MVKYNHWKSKDDSNLLNYSELLDIMGNSDKCIQNEHDSCDGTIKTVIIGSDIASLCACPCHNSSYQLVKRMFGVIDH